MGFGIVVEVFSFILNNICEWNFQKNRNIIGDPVSGSVGRQLRVAICVCDRVCNCGYHNKMYDNKR